MTELQVSTSPRSTWLWAPDEDTAAKVRAVVDGWSACSRRLVTDIDVGVVALDACDRLAESGFTFVWHESQHPLDRDGWPSRLPGMRQRS